MHKKMKKYKGHSHWRQCQLQQLDWQGCNPEALFSSFCPVLYLKVRLLAFQTHFVVRCILYFTLCSLSHLPPTQCTELRLKNIFSNYFSFCRCCLSHLTSLSGGDKGAVWWEEGALWAKRYVKNCKKNYKVQFQIYWISFFLSHLTSLSGGGRWGGEGAKGVLIIVLNFWLCLIRKLRQYVVGTGSGHVTVQIHPLEQYLRVFTFHTLIQNN